MLSLRQFDNNARSASHPWVGSQFRRETSTVLEFAAQHSDSLPASIASFANPVHIDSSLSSTADTDEIEQQELHALEPIWMTSSQGTTTQAPASDQPSRLEFPI